MYWDATKVEAVSNRCIYVELKNGVKGYFDVSNYWDKGVLKELQNPLYFKQVAIQWGVVSWPHGQDIAPETLLENLQPGPVR